jgi:metal-responsive CopG/Arc/MetJ family transcriptional regulator
MPKSYLITISVNQEHYEFLKKNKMLNRSEIFREALNEIISGRKSVVKKN